MFGLLKDSGWDGMRGSVEGCDDCGTPTIHLTAPGGVSVCGDCGYNPMLDALTDASDSDDTYSNVVYLSSYQ